MTIIEPHSWRAQPWKNGAGTTYELLRLGDGDAFAVRVSVAEVTAPAPFSTFAGVRRWLYLLAGGPVVLVHEGTAVTLREPGDGFAFAGDARVDATAVATASRDLNFMVRADLSARADIVRGAATKNLVGDGVGVFAIAGDVRVDGAALPLYGFAWGGRALVVGQGGVAATLEVSGTLPPST